MKDSDIEIPRIREDLSKLDEKKYILKPFLLRS